MHKVFNNLDVDGRGALTYVQFERFLYLNCLDFVLDFYDTAFINHNLFSKEALESLQPRCTFSEIMKFIDDQSCFKHSKQDYKEALTFFMRGYDPKKQGINSINYLGKSNIEDVCSAMRRHTDMSEEEVKGYENAHDMQLLIDEVAQVNDQETLKMIEIEESAKLLYKY